MPFPPSLPPSTPESYTLLEALPRMRDSRALEAYVRTCEAGVPWAYRLEGDVVDVSRQRIANRTSTRIDPAPWYVGVKNPPYFADAQQGIDTQLIAVALDGKPAAGVAIDVELHRIQWSSVRQATGKSPVAVGEDPIARLTDRELEVFRLIGECLSTEEIARRMSLTTEGKAS